MAADVRQGHDERAIGKPAILEVVAGSELGRIAAAGDVEARQRRRRLRGRSRRWISAAASSCTSRIRSVASACLRSVISRCDPTMR